MQFDIKSCFSKAANTYDIYADFQYQAALKLVDTINITPKHILDIGCGTGFVTTLLKQKFPHIQCTLLDISPAMLIMAQQKLGTDNTDYICGKADDIQLITKIIHNKNIDMIVSNLCFQWLDNPLYYIEIYKNYVPVCIHILLENSLYQWYDSVKSVNASFEPPITLLKKHEIHHHFDYHIQYDTGLNFLKTQKNLGTLVSKKPFLSIKQLRNACHFFENQHNATISYFSGIIYAH